MVIGNKRDQKGDVPPQHVSVEFRRARRQIVKLDSTVLSPHKTWTCPDAAPLGLRKSRLILTPESRPEFEATTWPGVLCCRAFAKETYLHRKVHKCCDLAERDVGRTRPCDLRFEPVALQQDKSRKATATFSEITGPNCRSRPHNEQ